MGWIWWRPHPSGMWQYIVNNSVRLLLQPSCLSADTSLVKLTTPDDPQCFVSISLLRAPLGSKASFNVGFGCISSSPYIFNIKLGVKLNFTHLIRSRHKWWSQTGTFIFTGTCSIFSVYVLLPVLGRLLMIGGRGNKKKKFRNPIHQRKKNGMENIFGAAAARKKNSFLMFYLPPSDN